MKVTLTAGGNLLVCEGGTKMNSGRISLVTRGGARRTIIEGLPGAPDNGLYIGPTSVVQRENTLFILMGEGDVLVRGPRAGTEVPNPAGPSSPIFSSLLALRADSNLETLPSGFTLKPEDQNRLADGLDVTLDNGSGVKGTLQMVADIRDFVPDPNNIVRASDPFGLELDSRNPEIAYIADAGRNTVWRVNLASGKVQLATRFAPVPQPRPGFAPVVDAVPTSVHQYGDQLLVTFLTGFPFNPGMARVMVVDPATGSSSPFLNGLSSAMDIAFRPRATRTQFFTLEFSTDQSASPAPPGRLMQFDTADGKVLANNLITPTSLALDAASGEIFVTELATGLLRVFKAQ